MLVNIKDTVALFSALDVLVREKMRLAQFSLHFARHRMTPNVPLCCNHYTSTYFILSRLSDRNSLSLSLWGRYFREKTSTCHSTLLRIAVRVSTCIIHVQLADSRPEGQCLVSNK